MGFGPVTGPTLNTTLCHIRALVGRMIKKKTVGLGGQLRVWEKAGFLPGRSTTEV